MPCTHPGPMAVTRARFPDAAFLADVLSEGQNRVGFLVLGVVITLSYLAVFDTVDAHVGLGAPLTVEQILDSIAIGAMLSLYLVSRSHCVRQGVCSPVRNAAGSRSLVAGTLVGGLPALLVGCCGSLVPAVALGLAGTISETGILPALSVAAVVAQLMALLFIAIPLHRLARLWQWDLSGNGTPRTGKEVPEDGE